MTNQSPEFKTEHAQLLNRLSEMIQSPYYALACHTLVNVEMLILEQEREISRLKRIVFATKDDAARWKFFSNSQAFALLGVGNAERFQKSIDAAIAKETT